METHRLIDGRRWRVTDPAIPETLRQELVNELMAARRAVGAEQRADDAAAVAAARARVANAKVALGERGPKWWEERSPADHRARMTATMHALLQARDPQSTICPSDVARAAASPQWRMQIELAREVARALHRQGIVEIRQGGLRVEDLDELSGPIRIGRGADGNFS